MTTTMPISDQLSATLKERTAAAHSNAENSQFMARLATGELDKQAVATLTVQYFHIYSALEAAVRRAAEHPAVALIADERLERVDAIDTDLTAMLGADWKDTTSPLSATSRYAAELDGLDATDGPEVVAHHYVRYLGDIAGGQVLARVFRNAYDLGDDALNFYDFSAVGKIPPYRTGYKASLDTMELTTEERDRLINTAQHAFELNQALFEELSSELR
ncbi:hypothetical protein A0K93_08495 [Corynebacterium sp. BCW_4722]|nr:hypothetical protein A0K93_08495 [Corynebacterium sp. BCW_4722]